MSGKFNFNSSGISRPDRFLRPVRSNIRFSLKKAKCLLLAPIEVEILLYWCSVQEIAAESGTIFAENA